MKSSTPKISIVTPSFNQGEYLEETIDSVLSQNYPNLEYIIMDGGSSDNSVDIIKKYEKHLTYWESNPDRGQSHAINKGLKKCTGDVFNWLCSDDYLEKGSLQVIGDVFQDKNIHIISGKFRVFGDGENTIQNGTTIYNSLEETLAKIVNMQPSTFFRTELVKEANGVNEKLHYFMDKELLMKIIFKYGVDGFKSLYELEFYPKYNIYECTKFIMEKLDENGFKLKYTHPNMLWITWNHWIPMHDRANIKKNTGVNVDGLGNIIRKKKGKDMTNSLFLFNDNIKNVKNVKKNKTFKDVKTYKPTGKFIYNNSLIENTTI